MTNLFLIIHFTDKLGYINSYQEAPSVKNEEPKIQVVAHK
jgi:hypothetical protein